MLNRVPLPVKVACTIATSLVAAVTLGFVAHATGTITVETIPDQTLLEIISSSITQSWPWFIIRASGLVAGAATILLLLSGIGSVTGHFFRWLEPLTAWATHRALGITASVAVLIHVVTLLFDHYQPFSLIDVLVPWVSQYKTVQFGAVNLGSLWVAFGVLALYGIVTIVLTSLKVIDKKPKLWKRTHLLSYCVIALVFFHALFLGTDTSSGGGRAVWIAGGVVVLVAIIARVRRARL